MTGRRIVPAALALAMLAVAALAVATPRLIDGTGEAQAHSGQLSPKDGCHRHKAAGERHWHVESSATRGGECVKRDGVTFHIQEVEVEAPAPEIKTPWEACPNALAAMQADRDSLAGATVADDRAGLDAEAAWH